MFARPVAAAADVHVVAVVAVVAVIAVIAVAAVGAVVAAAAVAAAAVVAVVAVAAVDADVHVVAVVAVVAAAAVVADVHVSAVVAVIAFVAVVAVVQRWGNFDRNVDSWGIFYTRDILDNFVIQRTASKCEAPIFLISGRVAKNGLTSNEGKQEMNDAVSADTRLLDCFI